MVRFVTAHRLLIWTIIFALSVIVIPTFAQEDTEETELITAEAFITSVSIVVDEMADESPVIVNVSGEAGDPCTEIESIEQTNEDDTIFITITTSRDANLMCAAVLEAFDAEITLDLAGLDAGDYTVSVNGVEETFTLPDTLVLTEEPIEVEAQAVTECPEASEDTILLETALYCFLIPADYMAVSNEFLALINSPLTEDDARASLLLEVRATQALVLVQAVANLGDDYLNTPLELISLTNTDALITELNSGNGEHVAFILKDGNLFILSGTPNNEDLPEASATMDTLWELVLSTIVVK